MKATIKNICALPEFINCQRTSGVPANSLPIRPIIPPVLPFEDTSTLDSATEIFRHIRQLFETFGEFQHSTTQHYVMSTHSEKTHCRHWAVLEYLYPADGSAFAPSRRPDQMWPVLGEDWTNSQGGRVRRIRAARCTGLWLCSTGASNDCTDHLKHACIGYIESGGSNESSGVSWGSQQ